MPSVAPWVGKPLLRTPAPAGLLLRDFRSTKGRRINQTGERYLRAFLRCAGAGTSLLVRTCDRIASHRRGAGPVLASHPCRPHHGQFLTKLTDGQRRRAIRNGEPPRDRLPLLFCPVVRAVERKDSVQISELILEVLCLIKESGAIFITPHLAPQPFRAGSLQI